jgi:hypothetical protein
MKEAGDPVLMINGPNPFYSGADEDHFFGWLQSIPAIKRVRGVGTNLELNIQRPIDTDSLCELIALLTRYDVDRRPLRALCDEQLDDFFRNERTYWYSAVYG